MSACAAGGARSAGSAAATAGSAAATVASASAGPRVVIFTHSTGYRHASIEAAAEAFRAALVKQGFATEVTADPTRLSAPSLAGSKGVVLISNTGKPLGDPGTEALAALEAFVRSGGALVGVHAASSTKYDPGAPYTRIIGGRFVNHPGDLRAATCFREGNHASVARLPVSFDVRDEIYVLDNLHARNQIVLRCASLTGDVRLPIAWTRAEGEGRVFYSALGHSKEDFAAQSPIFRDHFLPGALWALRR